MHRSPCRRAINAAAPSRALAQEPFKRHQAAGAAAPSRTLTPELCTPLGHAVAAGAAQAGCAGAVPLGRARIRPSGNEFFLFNEYI
jgi:hypothetical protein